MINPSGQLGTAGRTHVACGFSWCRATAGVGGSTGAAWPLRAGGTTPALVQLLLCSFTTNPTKVPPSPGHDFFKRHNLPSFVSPSILCQKMKGGVRGASFSMPYFAKKKKSLLPPDQALGPQDIEALSFTSTNNPTCTQSARVSNIRPSGPQALEMRPCRIYSAGA